MPLGLILVAVVLALGPVRPALAQTATTDTRADRLEQWLAAIARHTPGEVDDDVEALGRWTASQWQDLIVDSQVFARGVIKPEDYGWVIGDRGQRLHIPSRYYSAAVRERIFALVCAFATEAHPRCKGRPTFGGDVGALAARATVAREEGDPCLVLRLAALLQLDLIAWGGTEDTMSPIVSTTATRLWLDHADGQANGIRDGGGQWQIAYGIVDAILARDTRTPDPWVRRWYVATADWMQRESIYDEAHVEHALRFFRDDPELLFFRGTQHEIDASKAMQLSARSATLPAGATSQIQNTRSELRAAASDLRKVVLAAPTWNEAHLRLGRVLAQLSENAEAADELRLALETADEKPLAYLAALFLGDVEARLGRTDSARERYRHAAALYPGAQSPYLALSQLERQLGNREAARQAIVRVYDLPGGADDPWWGYLWIQSRNAEQRLALLRAVATRPPP